MNNKGTKDSNQVLKMTEYFSIHINDITGALSH